MMGADRGLIDVHSHFLTEYYVSAAIDAGHVHPDGMRGWPAYDHDEHLRSMDRWGIERSILSISSPGTHFGDDEAARALTQSVNAAGATLAQQRPERFGHFASLSLPDVDGAVTQTCFALDELGSQGVTVESNSGGVYLGDARYGELYDVLNARRAVVFIHPTSPPHADDIALGRPRPMIEFLFDTARTVIDLLWNDVFSSHPDIRWIVPHGGGVLPLLADRVDMFRRVFTDGAHGLGVADQMRRLWFDLAGTPFPRQIPVLADLCGHEQLVYGSDYCWTPDAGVDAQVGSIDRAAPADGGLDWRRLLRMNAEALLAPSGGPHAETVHAASRP
jgi:6-methylsalicylate decarboxylase